MKTFAIFDNDGFPKAFYNEDVHGTKLLPVYGSWPQRDVYGPWPQMDVYGSVPEPTEENPNPVAPVVGTINDPSKHPDVISTEDDPDKEPPIIGYEPNPDCLIPSDAIEITDEQWLEFINNSQHRKWQDGHVVPYDPPPPEPIIPDRVSRRQFRRQLFDDGLLASVEAWVSQQDEETQMAYADAATFVRTDEMMQQGFAALGFTVEQVDAFFTDAAGL